MANNASFDIPLNSLSTTVTPDHLYSPSDDGESSATSLTNQSTHTHKNNQVPAANNPSTPPKNRQSSNAVNSTPVTMRVSNFAPYTSQHIERDERVTAMWHEVTGKIVGPVSPIAFIARYLARQPKMTPWTPPAAKARFTAVSQVKAEPEMYGLIIEALKPFLPHHELIDTHAKPAETFDMKIIKPDLTLYRKNKDGTPRKCVNDITKATMYLEAKFSERDDPFDDDASEFERATDAARDTLGQLTAYATAQQAAQFRAHVFQVLFLPQYARILRWDRSGVVVTKKIPLDHWIFAMFFWSYDHATLAQRGYDQTVSRYRNPRGPGIRSKLKINRSEKLFQISIGNKMYIIGKPTYRGVASPIGRSTRSFKAYSLSDGCLVWLKDTWRIIDYEREDVIYRDLWKANVPHIAKVHAASDILDEITQAAKASTTFRGIKGCKPLRTLQHYRIALEEIGRDLTSFDDNRELVKAIRDAVEAHTCAYFDARILHRDISVGNILIGPQNKGLLIDWDLCKRVDDLNRESSAVERTGTWQFMSAHLLNDPHATSTREDDLEAFLHVLTWVALQYTAHGLDAHAVGTALNQLFDERNLSSEGIVGGNIKRLDLGHGNTEGVVKKAQFQNPPLTRLFGHLRATLAARYAQPATPAVEEYQAMEEEREKVRTGTLPQELMDTLPKELMDTLSKDAIVKLLNKFMLSPLGLEHHPVKMYNTALANLKTREWPANVFDKELDSQDWHVNGEPVIRDIFVPARSLGNKRKTQSDFEQQGYPKQMRTFSPNPISEEAEHVSAVDSTGNLDTETVVGEELKEEAEEEHNAELEAMYAALREEYAGDDYVYERVSEYESESESEDEF